MSTNINYTYSKIYNFSASGGTLPFDGLYFGNDGFLYGTTSSGGTYDYGTIFKIDPVTYSYTVIHHFSGGTSGSKPYGGVIQGNDGILYGTTWNGSSLPNRGVIYSCSTSGNYGVLYNLGSNNNPGGALLEVSNGALYGTSVYGGLYGSVSPHGSIFSADTLGSNLSMIYSFSGSANNQFPLALPKDGRQPNGNLIKASNGVLYGTTIYDGLDLPNNGGGIIFSYSTSGNYQVLYRFSGGTSDGRYPAGGLIEASNGILYGTTSQGGLYGPSGGYGTIFSYDILGNYNLLYNFSGSTIDGGYPYGSLIQGDDGLLYGMTVLGGSYSAGTIFSFDITTNTLTKIHDFEGSLFGDGEPNSVFYAGGASIQNRIIQTPSGKFYGVTYKGGSNSGGTIYEFYNFSCIVTGSTITGCTGLTIVSATTTNPQCNNNGSITITISGTNPNYTYYLNGSQYSATTSASTYTFKNLSAGNYVITAKDNSGTISVYPSTLTLVNQNLYVNAYKLNNSQYCFDISGGTPPYNIVFSGSAISAKTGLTSGTYCFDIDCGKTYNYFVGDVNVSPICMGLLPSASNLNPFNQSGCIVGEVFPHPADVQIPLLPYSQLPQPPLLNINLPNFNIPLQPSNLGFPGYPNLIEWYQIEFSGTIVIPTTGNYQFRLCSDDGSIFTIQLPSLPNFVINNDGYHPFQCASNGVTLTAGTYPFTMSYYQGPKFNIGLQLFWSTPSDPNNFVIVPVSAFTCTSGTTGCECLITGTTTIACSAPNITSSFTAGTCLNSGIININVNSGGTPNYTYYVYSGTNVQSFGPTSASSHTFTGLPPGTWSYYVKDSALFTSNVLTSSFSNTFGVNFYPTSIASTGGTFCYKVTGSTLNVVEGLYYGEYSASTINNPRYFTGNTNTINCFSVPISDCGTHTFILQELDNVTSNIFIPPLFNCDAIDVVFVLDYTNTLQPAIQQIKSGIGSVINTLNTINPVQGYRLALVTFDEWCKTKTVPSPYASAFYTSLPANQKYVNNNLTYFDVGFCATSGITQYVTAIQPFTTNATTFTNNLNVLNTPTFPIGQGLYYPEPGDLALEQILNGQSTSTNTFIGNFRPNAAKYVIYVTDSQVSGVDDQYTLADMLYMNNIIAPQFLNLGINFVLLRNCIVPGGCVGDALDQLVVVTSGLSSNNYSTTAISQALLIGCSGQNITTISQVSGCTFSTNYIVPCTLPTIQTLFQNPYCEDYCFGYIDIIVTGNTTPTLTFELTDVNGNVLYDRNHIPTSAVTVLSTYRFEELCAGTYYPRVIDTLGYVATGNPITLSYTFDASFYTQPILTVNNTGFICVDFSGNSPTNPVYITNNSTLQQIVTATTVTGVNCFELPAGYCYNLLIQDALSNCDVSGTTCIPLIPLSCGTISYTHPNCNLSNGTITTSAVGGTLPYTFSLYLNNVLVGSPITTNSSSVTFSNLNSGNTYSVVLKDFNNTTLNCFSGITLTGASCCNLSLNATVVNGDCKWIQTGSITINNVNGVAPFQYSIDGGTTFVSTNVFTNLGFGTYNLVIKDSVGCIGYSTASVGFINPPVINPLVTGVTCNNFSSGAISLNVSNGTPPLQYSIDGGITLTSTQLFTGLTAGIYDLYVRDSDGCFDQQSVTIPGAITASLATTPTTCINPNGGKITVTPTSGVPPYQYSINGSAFVNSNVFTGLTGGQYSITIKDKSGCTATTTTQIEYPINLTIYPNRPTCAGIFTGSITALASGATAPYTYSIDGVNFLNNNVFTNLAPGDYTIFVRDVNGCSAATSVTLSQQEFLIGVTTTQTNDCIYRYPLGGGTALINILNGGGGVGPYEYSLDGGITYTTNNYFTGLTDTVTPSFGQYYVTVRDTVLSCETTTAFLITSPPPPTLGVGSTRVLCNDPNSGTLTVNITNGLPTFAYTILQFQSPVYVTVSTGTTSSNNFTVTGLTAGQYIVKVLDQNSCWGYGEKPIPPALDIVGNSDPVTCQNSSGGSITINSSLGTAPYQYSIDGGTTYSTSNQFTGLTAGTYQFIVKDSNGCTASTTSTVSGALAISAVSTNETCSLTSAATINAIVLSGGNSPYTYSIDGTTFTSSGYFTGLTTGTYDITAKDFTGCTATTQVIISTPLPMTLGVLTTPETCSQLGKVEISILGGSAPYTYSVSGGTPSNLPVLFLSAGTYDIVVTDNSGCTANISATIDPANPVTVSGTSTNESCQYSSGGTITINASGGTGQYFYSIDNGSSYYVDNYFTGLTIGSFNLLVKDSVGCTGSTTVNVDGPIPMTVSAVTVTGFSCTGLTQIDVTFSVNGGTAPYTYYIDNISSSTPTINVSSYLTQPGAYSLSGTVIDRFGCSGSTIINFSATSASTPTLNLTSSGHLSCDGSSFVTLSASTNLAYDQIYWSNGLSGVTTIDVYLPGVYFYYLTKGTCTFIKRISIKPQSKIPPVIIANKYVTCICTPVTLFPSLLGNVGQTYTDFVWSNGDSGATTTVSSCTEGTQTYYATAKDQNGCTVTSNTITILYTSLDIGIHKVDATCYNCADGFAEVVINKGFGPFTYQWTGTTSTTSTANNLIPGTYTVLVTDSTGCVDQLTFEILGQTPADCIYEPVRDNPLPGQSIGNITLNPDGTVSFLNTTALPVSAVTSCVPEDCCLKYSTVSLPLQYCNCKCYWREPGCTTTGDTQEKILLGVNGTNGVPLISSHGNVDDGLLTSLDCRFQVQFDYLFNFDCQKLLDCVDTNYSGSVLTFLDGLSAYATVDVLTTGNTYVTKQTEKIWQFSISGTPSSGVYFGSQDTSCDLIRQLIYGELGVNCSLITDSTFAPIWRHASFKIYDSLSGETIKIGIILEGFNCDYNILLDNLNIDEVCVITTEQILNSFGGGGSSSNGSGTNAGCPGFALDRVIDNKKSWVYNDTTYNRDWYHLKYRDTSYVDYDERLDINTKEIDLDINIANAINYDAYCFYQNCATNCVSGVNLINFATFPSNGSCFNQNGVGLFIPFSTGLISSGDTLIIEFDVAANTQSFAPVNTNLAYGLLSTTQSGEFLLGDNVTVTAINGSSINHFSFTATAPTTLSQYDGFYIRATFFKNASFCVILQSVNITKVCPPAVNNASNLITVNSGTTYNQFLLSTQTDLIDVKSRQAISDYPLARYVFDSYLGICDDRGPANDCSINNVPCLEYTVTNNTNLNLIFDYTDCSGTTQSYKLSPGTITICSTTYPNFNTLPVWTGGTLPVTISSLGLLCGAVSGGTSGTTTTSPCSNQYNYNSLSSFINTIGGYWLDLVEQLLPATVIWKGGRSSAGGSSAGGGGVGGGSMTYQNSTFDYNKYQYRNFDLGYCNPEYCFNGDILPPFSAACYVTLTPVQFSGLAVSTASQITSTLIGNSIQSCANNNSLTCCNLLPLNCFVSATFSVEINDDGTSITAITPTITDPTILPTSDDFLQLFYESLTDLGYSDLYHDQVTGFEWSKQSMTGCGTPIQFIPKLEINYSCITSATFSFSSISNSTIVYQSLFSNYPNYATANPIGRYVIDGNNIMYAVGSDLNGISTDGYIYTWDIDTPGFNIIKTLVYATDKIKTPASGLVLASDGYLYGTTLKNDLTSPNSGALYKVNPNSPYDLQVLYKFDPSNGDGACWLGQEILLHSDGDLYIPLLKNSGSQIYKWRVGAQTGNTIYNFTFNTGSLFFTENSVTNEIYYTTALGGSFGAGSIGKFNTTTLVATPMYSFNPTLSTPNNINSPSGALKEGVGGLFYGLTSPSNVGYPSLYVFNDTNNTVAVLHTFYVTPTEGKTPKGDLVLNNNFLFGVCTENGTSNYGNIFTYNITFNSYSVLKQFDGISGAYGNSSFYGNLYYNSNDDYIYGITPNGGSATRGNIYRFNFSGTSNTGVTITGVAIYNCTLTGSQTNITIDPWSKNLVNTTSSASNPTPITGLSCTNFCATYVENNGIEVIVEDLSATVSTPCASPASTQRCHILYATHIDDDVYFDGRVLISHMVLPTDPNNITVITNNP